MRSWTGRPPGPDIREVPIRPEVALTASARSTSCRILIAAAFACAVRPAAAQGPARVHGMVRDAGSGRPVPAALVVLEEAGVSAETTDRGRFVLPRVEAGTYHVRVERLGYETRRGEIRLEPDGSIDLTIDVSTKPVELDPIEVVTRSGRLVEAGYYDRRDTGGMKGHFITYDDLIRRNAMGLTDVLVDVPGVRVHYLQPGRTTVRFNRSVPEEAGPGQKPTFAFSGPGNKIPGCEPDLYLDGRLYRNASPSMQTGAGGNTVGWSDALNKVDDFNAIPVSQIDGVEVYVGAAVPAFVRNTACGVILVWSRR